MQQQSAAAAALTSAELKVAAASKAPPIPLLFLTPPAAARLTSTVAARQAELQQELGEGEGVSALIAASHDFAQLCVSNQVRAGLRRWSVCLHHSFTYVHSIQSST